MNQDKFSVLCTKAIYEILDGDVEFGTSEEFRMSMPKYTGQQLVDLCSMFGLNVVYGASRWTYLDELFKYLIKEQRADELLVFLFDKENFDGLKSVLEEEVFDKAYKTITENALNRINSTIRISGYELKWINHHFYMVKKGDNISIDAEVLENISVSYVQGLRERCKKDFVDGNYDSVITKSRTLIEEVLIHILESNDNPIQSKGDLKILYNDVKELFGMQQSKEYDKRVNGMLSGLEKIIDSVAKMRNNDSDAHGVGAKRIKVRDCEAKLVMNSAIVFCDYYLSINEEHKKTIGV